MPPVVRLAIAYGAGLIAGLVFLPPVAAIVILLSIMATAMALRAPAREGEAPPGWWSVLMATAAVGLLAGRNAGLMRHHECAEQWRAGRHMAQGVLMEPLSAYGRGVLTIERTPDGCGGRLTARFPPVGAGRTAPPVGGALTVAGTVDDAGIFRVERWSVDRVRAAWLPRLGAVIATRITTLYGPRAPLVEALILGRRSDVDPALRQDFVDAGLAHLLAISGLHVGILVGWVALLVGLVASRRVAWIAVALFAWAYALFLGFPPPATRAAAFVAIACVARLRERHPAPLAVLAVGALVVVSVDPTAVTAVGFWLSLAAVWGTTWAIGPGTRPAAGSAGRALARELGDLVRVSAGAVLATAPISAFAFGSVAPIGIAVNLLAIPVAALAVPAAFLSLIVPAAAAGAGLGLAILERLAAIGAAVPAGHLTGPPGPGFALPWAMLLAGAIWVRRDRPTMVVARLRLLVGGAAIVWILTVATAVTRLAAGGGLTIYVIDVGQGDGIALRTPHGHWVLVDGGPRTPVEDAGAKVIVPFLERHGVRRLDAVIPSHADADHLGGIPSVLRTLHPALLLDNGQPVGTALYLDYLRAENEDDPEWHAARAGDTLTIDSVTFAVLHPTAAWEASHLETNQNSVVLRVTYGAFDAILTGDIDTVVERALLPTVGRAEFLKVAHHGSASSTGNAWLSVVGPAAAAISVGARNRYGHPSPQALSRLRAHGVRVWRTDQGGTVTIRSDGRYFVVGQDSHHSLVEKLRCLLQPSSPSNASSPIRNACTPAPPVSFPTFSTTSPSRPRSSPAMSGGPG